MNLDGYDEGPSEKMVDFEAVLVNNKALLES